LDQHHVIDLVLTNKTRIDASMFFQRVVYKTSTSFFGGKTLFECEKIASAAARVPCEKSCIAREPA